VGKKKPLLGGKKIIIPENLWFRTYMGSFTAGYHSGKN